MGDTWNCCRTCLNTQPLHPIFALPEHSDKYSDVILSTTGVKIDINDTLPHDICSECIKFINESLRFRKHCKHAQKSLEDYKLYNIKLEHIHDQNVECDKTNVIDISELLPPEEDYKDYDDNVDTFNCEDKIETSEKEYETKVDNVTEDPAGVTITNKRTRNVKIKTRKAAERKDESKGKGSKSETVKQEIECEFCHKILTSKLSLRNHYKIHTGFDVVCEHCGKKFITRRLLLMHCRAKHGYEKTDKCSFCDYKASNAEQVKIKPNDGLSQKICNACINVMQSALLFRKTSRKAEKTLLRASSHVKVKKKYSKKTTSVKKNLQIERDKDVADDHSYDYLDNDFAADDVYNETDIEPYNVVEPKKLKQPKASMGKQRVTRTPNATSYKCTFCTKEFRMKATYKAHLRFHTHYCVCESCGKRCRNHNQLQEHKRARHGLGRIHKCAYCEYSSATKEALTIHERRHTGERPYVCDHCGATFHRRSNLVQHIAIHLPEKNFQCDMCPKRLKSRKFLQIHKHNAHTGRRYGYLCPICEHRFEKPNKVRAHTRRVHGLPDGAPAAIVRVQL